MALSFRTRLPASCTRLQSVSAARPRSHARAVKSRVTTSELGAPLDRRAALLLSVPFVLVASPAHSAYIPLDDSRKTGAKESMEAADQARDDRLDERRRFSFESVGKLSRDEHQQRAKESYNRLARDVKYYLDKKLYNRVSNELNLQMASLRYDLEQIANQGDKSARKAAQKQSKDAIKAIEQLDLYARLNQGPAANQAYSDAISKLGTIVKSYG